jgi:adenylosuccinate synthase
LVVDLGFGDAGKGLLCDYLVRATKARWVVRFNGGAQAGHNVVTADGSHHTFSQFGAGSFVPGVQTYLARDVVVHPTALGSEARHLVRAGVTDAMQRMHVDPQCRVTTPFHQASNRVRELLRGAARHGSCGVGVGETVQDSVTTPELTLRFGELKTPERARDKLFALRALKQHEFREQLAAGATPDVQHELLAFTDAELPDRWLAAASDVARQVSRAASSTPTTDSDAVVFEGAQGVLLDERFGFHPYTTYSRTTFEGADEELRRWAFNGDVQRIGVLRSYAVRHGPGPLPTEAGEVTARTQEPHNQTGSWQQRVRKGWLDMVLLDYALRACGGVDCLAVTHLDALRALPDFQYCHAYSGIGSLPLPGNLAEQAALTARLAAAQPSYRTLSPRASPDALREIIAQYSAAPVRFTGYGPRANDVVVSALSSVDDAATTTQIDDRAGQRARLIRD